MNSQPIPEELPDETSEITPDTSHQVKQPKKEIIILQSVKILFLILGVFFTYTILIIAYGDEALVKFLKGISIKNFIEILTDLNLTELIVWIYFVVLFGVFYYINNIGKQKLIFPHLNIKQQTIVSGAIRYFREGSFTLPFVVMVVFPMVLQVILPGLIDIVAVVELLIPFIFIGELYRISEENLKKLFKNQDGIKQGPRLILERLIGVVLAFPLIVFILMESGLDRFLNLVHYLFLWPNPRSPIALAFWDVLNSVISINTFISSFFEISIGSVVLKYYIVTFVMLVITSKLYLILKRIIRVHSIRQIERFVLTYQ